VPNPGPCPACFPSTTCRLRLTALALVFLSCAAVAGAQTLNPRFVSFAPSDDHSLLDSNGRPVVTCYEFEIFQPSSVRPLLVANIGKPMPAADGIIYVDFMNVIGRPPLTGVPLEARVAAVGPAGRGESDVSNLFLFEGPAPAPSPSDQPFRATPSVRITSPSSGSVLPVAATVIVTAAASDATDQIAGVIFYVNGSLLRGVYAAPYTVSWKAETAGTYTFTAKAVSASGLQATAEVTVSVSPYAGSRSARPRPADAPPAGAAKARPVAKQNAAKK